MEKFDKDYFEEFQKVAPLEALIQDGKFFSIFSRLFCVDKFLIHRRRCYSLLAAWTTFQMVS